MTKADVVKALSAAQAAVTGASSEANNSTEYQIPSGDVIAHTDAADVTISADGKVVITPTPRRVILQDSKEMTKSASRQYWASAAGSTCSRCGGTGRA